MDFFLHVMGSIALVISLSTDAFAAGLSYGAGNIQIPTVSAAIISLICSAMLLLSMFAGNILGGLIPQNFTHLLCFAVLLALGFIRLFDSYIKNYIRKHNRIHLDFDVHHLKFILVVYADAECADVDHSKTLSAKEAAALAAALSLDSLAVGFGAAVSGDGFLLPVCISLLLTFLSVKAGWHLGKKLPALVPFDLSYLSAGLLILLAITRLL